MQKRPLWLAIGLVALIAGVIGWYFFRPELLFIDTAVNEDFPVVVAPMTTAVPAPRSAATEEMVAAPTEEMMAAPTEEMMAAPTEEMVAAPTEEMMAAPTEEMMAAPTAAPAEMQPQPSPRPAEPLVLATGQFHGVAHDGAGVATIYQLADGRRILRFTQFNVSNGPDLYVYMVAAPDANDAATVTRAGFVSLGRLKGNVGDQNYELPAELDLSIYRSVSVWCQRFSVNFAVAPLR